MSEQNDQKNKKLDKRDALPFPPTPSASIAGRTMQESVYRQQVKPRRLPADAPNILIVLIDDAGPALPVTFGGEIQTPTMDRIVGEGIAYNRFHTTAMCSPTRASISAPQLLTANDCLDIGIGLGSPVSLEYCDKAPFKFNGKIEQVHMTYVAAK